MQRGDEAGHLGEAAPDWPLLADHLRRHAPTCAPPGAPTARRSSISPIAATAPAAVMAKRADGVGARDASCTPRRRAFGQVNESADGKWLIVRSPNGDAGNGDIFAVKIGRHHARAARDEPGARRTPRALARREVARLLVRRVGDLRGVRAPLPERAVGALAGLQRPAGSSRSGRTMGRQLYYPEHEERSHRRRDQDGAERSRSGRRRPLFSLLPFVAGGADADVRGEPRRQPLPLHAAGVEHAGERD